MCVSSSDISTCPKYFATYLGTFVSFKYPKLILYDFAYICCEDKKVGGGGFFFKNLSFKQIPIGQLQLFEMASRRNI